MKGKKKAPETVTKIYLKSELEKLEGRIDRNFRSLETATNLHILSSSLDSRKKLEETIKEEASKLRNELFTKIDLLLGEIISALPKTLRFQRRDEGEKAETNVNDISQKLCSGFSEADVNLQEKTPRFSAGKFINAREDREITTDQLSQLQGQVRNHDERIKKLELVQQAA